MLGNKVSPRMGALEAEQVCLFHVDMTAGHENKVSMLWGSQGRTEIEQDDDGENDSWRGTLYI